MAIREDVVGSAVSTTTLHALSMSCPGANSCDRCNVSRSRHNESWIPSTNTRVVLQDPSVASSSVENRVAFLRSKNLTQEEIDAALARTGAGPPPPSHAPAPYQNAPPQYYQQYPQQHAAWQPPPPPPRRDWRDWFIVATVAGGVGYGLYALGKVDMPTWL